jgi:predicted metal-dependent hydrolase
VKRPATLGFPLHVSRFTSAKVWLPAIEAGDYFGPMSKKSSAIAALIEGFRGRKLDAHYLGYFECFNRQLFYEAHDVLEELWLAQRRQPNDAFYKGLIQLAGAFVHLQKGRLRPAAALFKLAEANLKTYPAVHESLELKHVLALIHDSLHRLESSGFEMNPLKTGNPPELNLQS